MTCGCGDVWLSCNFTRARVNFPFVVTLNWKWMMSPDCTTYCFPSMRYLPAALTSAMDAPLLCSLKSAKLTTSALMKPRSKSVWMTPAA